MNLLDLQSLGFKENGYFHLIDINDDISIRYSIRKPYHPHQIDFNKFELISHDKNIQLKIQSIDDLKSLLGFLGICT